MVLSKNDVFEILKRYKYRFEDDGVLIVGLFGSFSRDSADETSDVDVLIETKPLFSKKYKGLRAIVKLSEIREFLEKQFQRDVDLIDKDILVKNTNKHILQKAIYV